MERIEIQIEFDDEEFDAIAWYEIDNGEGQIIRQDPNDCQAGSASDITVDGISVINGDDVEPAGWLLNNKDRLEYIEEAIAEKLAEGLV